MNQYITGAVIKLLREKQNITQLQLADKLGVSDKAVSKWETGRGYTDVTLLPPIADALSVSVAELLSGEAVVNENVSANMLKSKFYVCPICSNVIHSMGEAVVSCHGIALKPIDAEKSNNKHIFAIEKVEDEFFVQIDHPMTKQHYISFIAAMSCDSVQIKKLYPESSAQARFKINGVKRIYYYCNRDGLFYIDVVKNIDN